MSKTKLISADIIEQGNGFPDVGDYIYDITTDVVYEVMSMGRIQTGSAAGAGNCRDAQVMEVGCASDLSEAEWEAISDCRVQVETDTAEG